MTPPSDRRKVYRFSNFEVDPSAGEVRKRGVRIRVQDQPLKLLNALIERPGELITREELHRKLWPDDTFVDFEHGLNAALTRLRQSLGDSALSPRFIESVPRRGYRFIAQVESGESNSGGSSRPEIARLSPDVEPTPPLAEAPLRARRTRMLLWVAAPAFFVTAAFVSLLGLRGHLPEGPREDWPVKFALLPPEETRFAEFDTIAVSPDGRFLALTATDASGETQLWVRPLSALQPRRLDGTSRASFPFWSADSRTIGFFANGKLKTIDSFGGVAKTICDAASGRGGTWNREGKIVFAPARNSPLFQVSSGGGEPKPLTSLDGSRGDISHRWPFFLPDGKHFIYLVRSAQGGASGIYVGATNTARGTLLLKDGSNAGYASARWGGGNLMFVRGGTLMSQPFDARSLTLSGDAVPVAEQVGQNQYIEPMRAKFSISGNGVLAYNPARGLDRLTWFDRNGVRLDTTVGSPGSHLHPSLSPGEHEILIDQADPHTEHSVSTE